MQIRLAVDEDRIPTFSYRRRHFLFTSAASSLNGLVPEGSAAKGHKCLGERAPFLILLLAKDGCFSDGIHENFGDTLLR